MGDKVQDWAKNDKPRSRFATVRDSRDTRDRAIEAYREGRPVEGLAAEAGGFYRAPSNVLWDIHQNVAKPVAGFLDDTLTRVGGAFSGREVTPAAAEVEGPGNNPFLNGGRDGTTITASVSPLNYLGPRAGQPGVLFRGVEGESINSTYRTPEHNREVGGVEHSYHTRKDKYGRALGRDSSPPPGMDLDTYYNILKAQNPGMDVIKNEKKNYVHMEPSPGTDYESIGYAGESPFLNPFDPSYFNQALGQIDAAGAAAMQPMAFSQEIGKRPELPELPETPKMDWTSMDEALEDLKPVIMTEKEQQQITRQNWFKGIGQAMAATPDGASLGKVLAMAGAGSLMGRAAGMEEIQARQDAFDEKMAAWKGLKFKHEGNKAAQMYQEAVAETNALYQHNIMKFQEASKRFAEAQGTVDIQGNNFVTSRVVTDENGNVRRDVQTIPIGPAIQAATATAKANVYASMGQAALQGAMLQTRMDNQLIAGTLLSQGAQSQAGITSEHGALTAMTITAQQLVDNGQVERLLGPEALETLMDGIDDELMREGYVDPTSKDYIAAKQAKLVQELVQTAFKPQSELANRMYDLAPYVGAADTANRYRDRTERSSVNASGRASISVSQ